MYVSLPLSGFILGIREVTGGASGGEIFVGVLMLLTAIGFAGCAAADFWLLTRVSHKNPSHFQNSSECPFHL